MQHSVINCSHPAVLGAILNSEHLNCQISSNKKHENATNEIVSRPGKEHLLTVWAETGRQCTILLDLSRELASQVTSIFRGSAHGHVQLCKCMSIDLGVTNKFSWVGKFSNMEPMNREDWLCLYCISAVCCEGKRGVAIHISLWKQFVVSW